MGFCAAGAERAEAAVVVWTGGRREGGVAVEVEAVGGVGAGEGAVVVCAVGHFAPIIIHLINIVPHTSIPSPAAASLKTSQ